MNITEIIGLRVYDNNAKAMGEIAAIDNSVITVSFHGEMRKYAFPACFSSNLEIEDETLQSELENYGADANFDMFKNNFRTALFNEINYLKTNGGTKIQVVDGELVLTSNGVYLYAFDTDTELHYPDGTGARIVIQDMIIYGYIISCEEFTIVISVDQYLGKKVSRIEFTVDEWMLIEALSERLMEMNVDTNSIAYEVACIGRSQMRAHGRILNGYNYAIGRATSERVTFVWGPPGTGKTETLKKITYECLDMGKRVLMLSYSNVSVDGAILRVARDQDFQPGEIIRYGYPRDSKLLEKNELVSYQYILSKYPQKEDEYNELLLEKKKLKKKDPARIAINRKIDKIREFLREKEKELVHTASFVATTVSKAVVDKTIYCQRFDVVIVDEASMAYVPQIVFAAGLAKQHFICMGDFCQLPAIVKNENETRLADDIFSYVGITNAVQNGNGHEWLVMLNRQYRMHVDIADFVSEQMYSGMLNTSEDIYAQREIIAACGPIPDEAMTLVDLSGMYSVCIKTNDGSRINLLSALICLRLAEQYILQDNPYDVGIITPYKAQSRLILAMVRDLQERDTRYKRITCATVHQFQGSEKAIIIYDSTDCYRVAFPGTLLTALKNDKANRLFNVAITRTQGKFLLVSNVDYYIRKKISKELMFRKAIDQMYKSKAVVSKKCLHDCLMSGNEGSVLIGMREDTWNLFFDDIKSASKSINIDMVELIDSETINELVKALELKKEKVQVSIRTGDDVALPDVMKLYKKDAYVTNPVTIIDKKIVWFGQPISYVGFVVEGKRIETDTFPCVRFEGEYTARMLQNIFEI